MSTQNNDILPRIWLVIDIIHYISQFSELSATVALARTCKLLYNSIIGCDNLWRRMYQQHFPRDIDTDIDWLQWQLKQEPRITEAATDMENRATSKVTWFQRYRQRASMGLNWQNNKPTSTFYIESTTVDKLLKSGIGRSMMTVSYPGWIAIANRYNPFVDLIKLSTNNIAKNYLLKLDENRLKFIKNIAFYQCQQQVDAIDEGMRVIVCLEYFEGLFDVLQVWDANSCQLLHFIDINGKWDGRIIGASLLVSSSQRIAPSNTLQSTYYTRLIYNIGSTTQLHEPPSIIFPNINYSYKYRIHSTSNNETIFVQYCKSEFRLDYKIIRVQLTPDTNLEIIGDDTMRMATIASDYITVSNLTKLWVSEFYSIDRDRILVHCNAHLPEGTSNVNIDNYQRYIRVVSLNKGVVFECNYPTNDFEKLILISAQNLVVFWSLNCSSLVVMSLLNGEILHEIHLKLLTVRLCYFQHLIDTKIIGYNYRVGHYCVIDAVTGNVDVYPYAISMVKHRTFALGHMLLLNKETALITSFIPELN